MKIQIINGEYQPGHKRDMIKTMGKGIALTGRRDMSFSKSGGEMYRFAF